MGYIGNQPGYGKPEVFVFTASGGETSVSTADDGRSINYAVGYVSVYLNGVLLVDGTDYTATNGSSITGLSALSASDVVTVVSFEVFAIPDAVSEQSGGAFLGDVTVPNLLVSDGGNIGSVSDPDAIEITSGGNVGINVASPSQKLIVGDSANTLIRVIADSGVAGIDFGTSSVVDAARVRYNIASDQLEFTNKSAGTAADFWLNSSGNLAFASGQGIDFSATAGTGTSELLDDYEEGTHTCSITLGGGASATLSQADINYRKIGNLVAIQGRLIVNSKSGSGNSIQISLPFQSTSIPGGYAPITTNIGKTVSKNYQDFTGLIWGSSSIFRVYLTDQNAISSASGNAAQLQANSEIDIMGVYFTA